MTSTVLSILLSIPVITHQQPDKMALVQPAPAPNDLTLYNQKGEQVAKCQIVDDGEKITGCKIQEGFTLDDVFASWADAYKKLEEK